MVDDDRYAPVRDFGECVKKSAALQELDQEAAARVRLALDSEAPADHPATLDLIAHAVGEDYLAEQTGRGLDPLLGRLRQVLAEADFEPVAERFITLMKKEWRSIP